ncbi:unnamed protein product [Urochloa humidicola]
MRLHTSQKQRQPLKFMSLKDPQISRPASPRAPLTSTRMLYCLILWTGKVAVADDGLVMLDRRVVSVEEEEERKGFLTFHVQATEDGDGGASVVKKVNFRTRLALRSQSFFELGFCKLSVTVAWSMLP